jgi:hypothetical protein
MTLKHSKFDISASENSVTKFCVSSLTDLCLGWITGLNSPLLVLKKSLNFPTFVYICDLVLIMSDSDDSDYVVEDFVKPETVRHTYKKDEDLISGSDSDKSGSGSEDEVEDSEVKNSQCVLNNGEAEEEAEEEPARPNNRFILYVTNLSGETTKSMLQDFFGDCGGVKSIRIPKVRLGCYAFVEMVDFAGFKVRKWDCQEFSHV